jgi:glyoxylase-like metal-dependent hydrolase (beta-lactamase superfamily II)
MKTPRRRQEGSVVETSTSVVVVDATLGVSDGTTLRSRVEALMKPLAAVVITHAHPDHYGGVAALLGDADVPVYAVAGVNDVIRRDDAAKEQILRSMFWGRVACDSQVSEPHLFRVGSA